MGDIRIPRTSFGAFLAGVVATVVILGLIGFVGAATVFNAGGGTIANLAEPAASSDAATKNYVDAASGVTLEGLTTNNFTGDFDSWEGVNDECNSDFPGSHFCSVEEIVASGTLTSGLPDHEAVSFWVRCDNYISETECASSIGYTSTTSTNLHCSNWDTASSSVSGLVMYDGGSAIGLSGEIDDLTCDNSRPVACCS